MRDGDQIRITGSGGAPALLTVARPFAAREIREKLASGEWRLAAEPEPGPAARADGNTPPPVADTAGAEPAGAADPVPGPGPAAPPPADTVGKPSQAAPKADWIDHVVRSRLLSRDDAENFTKADLVEMCK
ncbi:hypothetical protein ACWD4V_13855 [Streptomyces tsukubensis]